MSLFSGAPAPAEPAQHQIEVIVADGPLGGPSYGYRDARIDCLKGGFVCRLMQAGHPLADVSFGVAGTITPLVDLWIDEGRLPGYMRSVPKAGR